MKSLDLAQVDHWPSPLAATGLAYLVLERYFNAGDVEKQILVAMPFVGFLLGPVVTAVCGHYRIRPAHGLGVLGVMMGLAVMAAALATSLATYVSSLAVAAAISGLGMPLATAMWRQRVVKQFRGRLFSQVGVLASLIAVVVSSLITAYIGDRIEGFSLAAGCAGGRGFGKRVLDLSPAFRTADAAWVAPAIQLSAVAVA